MIIEWLYSVAAGFVGWVGDLMEPIELPSWLADGLDGISTFVTAASGLGAWFPWEVLALVVASMVAIYLVTLAGKAVLKLAAFFPLIGGSG